MRGVCNAARGAGVVRDFILRRSALNPAEVKF